DASWRERMLSRPDLLGRLGSLAPDAANAALHWAWVRSLLERMTGLAADRPLPLYAAERFDHWFHERHGRRPAGRGAVLLWDDTFVRHHEPQIGRAVVSVLEAAGFEVRLVANRHCCGRPAFSQGDLATAAAM